MRTIRVTGKGQISVLLLFSMEGDTDPEAYREIVGRTEI